MQITRSLIIALLFTPQLVIAAEPVGKDNSPSTTGGRSTSVDELPGRKEEPSSKPQPAPEQAQNPPPAVAEEPKEPAKK